ncbi:hypothetical protein GCM10020220_036180 [Nonomuraea rubra]
MLAVGVGAQAAFAAMFSGIPVTGVSMRAGYHLSTEQLGLVLACLGLGVAASDLVWGLLTDRFGDRRVLLTGLTATGALLAVMAAAVTPSDGAGVALLALCLALAGALGGSVNGASGRAVMTWFGEGERGFAMSIRQTAIPVGGAIGVALLPWLAGSYGFGTAYAASAACCLAARRPPGAGSTNRRRHRRPCRLGRRRPARIGPACLCGEGPARTTAPSPSGAGTCGGWPWRAPCSPSPSFASSPSPRSSCTTSRARTPPWPASPSSSPSWAAALPRIWTGRRTDRTGTRRTHIRAIGTLAGLAMAGAAVLTDAPTPLTVTALALAGLLANSWHGVAYTEIAAMAGASRAGTALGLLGTTLFAMGFVTPLLIPLIITHASWAAVWALAAAASLLAVPLALARREHAGEAGVGMRSESA